MSLTLLWDGETHYFEPRPKVAGRGIIHHNARMEHRINEHVYILRSGMEGAEPRSPVILKIARDAGEIAALELEASLYANELKSLQGKYVPHYFGIYHGAVAGSPVACMLLEYCTPGNLRLTHHEKK